MPKKEIYYAFVNAKRGRWIFPVESDRKSAKAMQDDGVQITPLEREFSKTDTMKLYCINVKGDKNNWILQSHLEPELAQEMANSGVLIKEANTEKIDVMEYFWRESSDPLITRDRLFEKKFKEEVSE